MGAPVKIFVSENAPSVKIHAMKSYGAEVVLVPGGYQDAENAGLNEASTSEFTWISPYNDGIIIAGQGTIALEAIDQLKNNSTFPIEDLLWLVPTSGGGLLAGIASAVDFIAPKSKVIGVQSDTSPFMHALFHHETQDNVIELPTLADGLAGPVEEGSITIPLVRNHVDEILLVNEDEIAEAIAYAWHKHGEIIEGAAAVVIAAVLSGKIKQRPIIAIVSGGNIQNDVFRNIIEITLNPSLPFMGRSEKNINKLASKAGFTVSKVPSIYFYTVKHLIRFRSIEIIIKSYRKTQNIRKWISHPMK